MVESKPVVFKQQQLGGIPLVELILTPDKFIGVKLHNAPTNQQLLEGAVTMLLMVAQEQANPQAFLDHVIAQLNSYYTIPDGTKLQ